MSSPTASAGVTVTMIHRGPRTSVNRHSMYGKLTNVAIKVFQIDVSRKAEFVSLCNDLSMLRHTNIQSVYNCVSLRRNENKIAVVAEFVGSSLYDFLRSTSDISKVMQVCWAAGIAAGMKMLHRANILHLDLAARNVLLADDILVPKICDFKMSRQVADLEVNVPYRDQFSPLKWMSPESLRSRMVSGKHDVWAFGVTLLEIVQPEYDEPYAALKSIDVASGVVNRRLRPTFSAKVRADNADLVDTILQCLAWEPADRPSFLHLALALATLRTHALKSSLRSSAATTVTSAASSPSSSSLQTSGRLLKRNSSGAGSNSGRGGCDDADWTGVELRVSTDALAPPVSPVRVHVSPPQPRAARRESAPVTSTTSISTATTTATMKAVSPHTSPRLRHSQDSLNISTASLLSALPSTATRTASLPTLALPHGSPNGTRHTPNDSVSPLLSSSSSSALRRTSPRTPRAPHSARSTRSMLSKSGSAERVARRTTGSFERTPRQTTGSFERVSRARRSAPVETSAYFRGRRAHSFSDYAHDAVGPFPTHTPHTQQRQQFATAPLAGALRTSAQTPPEILFTPPSSVSTSTNLSSRRLGLFQCGACQMRHDSISDLQRHVDLCEHALRVPLDTARSSSDFTTPEGTMSSRSSYDSTASSSGTATLPTLFSPGSRWRIRWSELAKPAPQLIGEGYFACVLKGRWRGTNVALKWPKSRAGNRSKLRGSVGTLAPDDVAARLLSAAVDQQTNNGNSNGSSGGGDELSSSAHRPELSGEHQLDALLSEHGDAFVSEAHLLATLSPHPNVVQFLGVCFKPFLIVTEFMSGGSLRALLDVDNVLLDRKMQLALLSDIAAGMRHLSLEGVVHKDLAARNVLLGGQPPALTAKVCDFGLSQMLAATQDTQQQYTEPGPTKWLAPESLLQWDYSELSDVWMYGVTASEVLTRRLPYADMPASQYIAQLVSKQLDPSVELRADIDDAQLAQLVADCLQFNTEDRPTFELICSRLDDISTPNEDKVITENINNQSIIDAYSLK